MKAFLALVAFEIGERKALLAAAAIASLLPLLAPLLPSTGSNPPEVIREAVMWVVLGGLAPLFALLLGIGFIGRDLSEGRMGFYYAQPLSGPTIWFSKITAVLVLVWAVELIIMLPTVVLSPDPLQFFYLANILDPYFPKWVTPTLLWVLSFAVLLLAHAIGIVWRARSSWLALDFLALLFVISVGWLSLRPFVWMAWTVVTIGIGWLAVGLIAGLIVAGAVQVSLGRVDLRRGHRTMSMTLWSMMSLTVVTLAAWSLWIRSVEPRDLDGITNVSVGSGEWIAVSGQSWGRYDYHPQFLVNIGDGRWFPTSGVYSWYGSYVRFSPDGQRAFWLVDDSGDERRLWFADLTASEVVPRPTEIVTVNDSNAYRVSSDGRRAAFVDDQTIKVFDVDHGALIMATRIEEPHLPFQLRFVTDDELSVLALMPWKREQGKGNRIFTLDLNARTLVEGPVIEGTWSWWNERWTLRDDRKLERIDGEERDRLVIVDPGSGEQIADLGEMRSWFESRIVYKERITLFHKGNNQAVLRLFDFDGHLLNEFPVGQSDRMYTGGEPRSGLLAIGHYNWYLGEGRGAVDYLTSVVDLDTGEVVRIFTKMAPVLGRWGTSSNTGAWTPGSVATRLLHGEDGELHLWDPETNDLKQLIPVPD